jgi:hypothetical protein
MATYCVEIVRVPYIGANGRSCVKVDFMVRKAADWSVDTVPPGMVAVFRVEHVNSATEAVSCIMEYAAGFTPCVRLILGGRERASFLEGK